VFVDKSDDPILRENRRSEVVRRLISHGVRTATITRLTGLTRNRQATVRRRLMVPDKARHRGPAKSALGVFLRSPMAREEAAALASISSLFDIPITPHSPAVPREISLSFVERLCEAYEAYSTCYPRTEVHLEEFIALRSSLAKGDVVRLGQCRTCKCMILVDRFSGARNCSHCAPEVTSKAP
jgi:hypothetical protein